VHGALIGALVMASLDNGMSMLDVDSYWQMIVKGADPDPGGVGGRGTRSRAAAAGDTGAQQEPQRAGNGELRQRRAEMGAGTDPPRHPAVHARGSAARLRRARRHQRSRRRSGWPRRSIPTW
jgi:hypothetical protein